MKQVQRPRLRPIVEALELRTLLSASTIQVAPAISLHPILTASKPAVSKPAVTPIGSAPSTTTKTTIKIAAVTASTGTLLSYDFNASNPWPAMTGTATNGGTAALIWGGVGTIDTEGGTTPSGALRLTATPPASGAWSSTLSSGQLAVSNTVTNLGLLTLAFNLSASQANPVALIIYSYNAQGQQTGGLATDGLSSGHLLQPEILSRFVDDDGVRHWHVRSDSAIRLIQFSDQQPSRLVGRNRMPAPSG